MSTPRQGPLIPTQCNGGVCLRNSTSALLILTYWSSTNLTSINMWSNFYKRHQLKRKFLITVIRMEIPQKAWTALIITWKFMYIYSCIHVHLVKLQYAWCCFCYPSVQHSTLLATIFCCRDHNVSLMLFLGNIIRTRIVVLKTWRPGWSGKYPTSKFRLNCYCELLYSVLKISETRCVADTYFRWHYLDLQ